MVISKEGKPIMIMNKEYHDIHKWLIKTFGKADSCESVACKKVSTKYTYALIKGKKYEMNRSNFLKLCYSCHRLYDEKPDTRNKRSESLSGRRIPRDVVEKMSIGRYKPVAQYDLDGNFIAAYKSIKEAETKTGILNTSITQCARGYKKYSHAGGYKWSFLTQEGLL